VWLGVGIDYALFIVTRYRQGLHQGVDPETAIIRAIDTAGRAVVFAGCTVVISLLGLFLMGVEFVADVVGVSKPGPIAPFVPMMMFAIVFGLSMDYEVFLLSRIREDRDRNHDNALAVADGVAATARVITAAALIMVTVFASFVLGDEPNI
jgi:uncharacterized membrane protein YdfJ with MMPL/SSD domain